MDREPAHSPGVEHTATTDAREQERDLRSALGAGAGVPCGRLLGLPDLGEDVWVDIAGACALTGCAPATITSWMARHAPKRHPFPPASRFLYRLYWPASTLQQWRAEETARATGDLVG